MYAEPSVSIILNTHRTRPDNLQDPILLKNLIKEAEERLLAGYDKRLAKTILDKLDTMANKIDHSHNLESLILFANAEFSDYTRLPVAVENRVIIDHNFATRDLVRAMHSEAHYYVLVISRRNARLIEAFSDKVIAEIGEGFPINNTLIITDKLKQSIAKNEDNIIEEFFNRVDKALATAIKNKKHPIVLATETRNAEHFKKISMHKSLIAAHINRNRDDDDARHTVADAWVEFSRVVAENNAARLSELKQAVSVGNYLSDLNDIYDAVKAGRGKTMFVTKGFFQPAYIENDQIVPVNQLETGHQKSFDDIVDELIELNLDSGGDTVFVEPGELDSFGNIALTTRY